MDHAIETNDLRPKSQRFRGNLLFEKRHLAAARDAIALQHSGRIAQMISDDVNLVPQLGQFLGRAQNSDRRATGG